MQIFISWSGDSSKEIAKAIKNWLPKVLQATKPYFTPQDIDKGSKWLSDILTKLNECAVGIICLTPENIQKPWILFEAGALSNRLDDAIVCPLLFNITKANVSGPLGIFQITEFNKQDFRDLLKTINSRLGESSVTDEVLNESFDMFFPKLEAEIKLILDKEKVSGEIKPIIRSDRELLEELLELARSQAKDNYLIELMDNVQVKNYPYTIKEKNAMISERRKDYRVDKDHVLKEILPEKNIYRPTSKDEKI